MQAGIMGYGDPAGMISYGPSTTVIQKSGEKMSQPIMVTETCPTCPTCHACDVCLSYWHMFLLVILVLVCGIALGMGIMWVRAWFAENYKHKEPADLLRAPIAGKPAEQ